MKPTLLILAAGIGSRYGGLKQVDSIGPGGEAIIEYSVFDAIRSGFGKVVFVIRQSIEADFKAKFSGKFDQQIAVDYVFQEMDTPIEGLSTLPPREKPWGTGHAVLVAEQAIHEPFAVINADDYYGITAFPAMAGFLIKNCTPDHYAMIGYVLKNTLSDNGAVSRGVCAMNEQQMLTAIDERHKVERGPNGVVHYQDAEGRLHPLADENLVSMNFFGFHHTIFPALRQHFIEFVHANGDKPKAEFYIPLFVTRQIQSGAVRMSVIPNSEQWYGVTYQEDKSVVQQAFSQLTAAGKYPMKLW
ncbi:MAG TPA: sugar phosphate nucleotidyltransferase [Saprospiraceae bacterium]|nr:sugar phosphate nucleotidyltransferase [Saprospiraceae bacterium]HMP25442.1 sugar phosphate nucleotidyltransferase [Saprospiraceae bacterium]